MECRIYAAHRLKTVVSSDFFSSQVAAYDEAVDNASVDQERKVDSVKPLTSVNPQLVHFDSGDESDRDSGDNTADGRTDGGSRPSSGGVTPQGGHGNGGQAHIINEDDDDDEDFHTDELGSQRLDTKVSGVSTRRKNYTLINFDSHRSSRRRQRPPAENVGSPAAKRVALAKNGSSSSSGCSSGGSGTSSGNVGAVGNVKSSPAPALGVRSTMAPGLHKSSPGAKMALPRKLRRPVSVSGPQVQQNPQLQIQPQPQIQPQIVIAPQPENMQASVATQSTAQMQIPQQAVQMTQMIPQQALQASAPIYVIQGAPASGSGAAPVFIFQSAPTIHFSTPMQQPQVMPVPIASQSNQPLVLVNPAVNQIAGQSSQLSPQAMPQTNYTLIPANAPLIAASSHTPSSSASVTITSPTDACVSSAGLPISVTVKDSSDVTSGISEPPKTSQSPTVVPHLSPSIVCEVERTIESALTSSSDLLSCQSVLSVNTSPPVTRTSTTCSVGPKPTAYVSPQPMPTAIAPQMDPSPSNVDSSSSNGAGKVTLFQIGGHLFDKDAQPVTVENGAVHPLISSTIEPNLLRMAASMINVEKNRRQVDNENNMISSELTAVGTQANTNQITLSSESNDGSQD